MHIAIEIKFLHAKIFHGCKKLKSGATKLEALYMVNIHVMAMSSHPHVCSMD